MKDGKLDEEDRGLLRQYESLFCNTGGNDVADLVERKDCNFYNNAPTAILQVACMSQLSLLRRLKAGGHLQ